MRRIRMLFFVAAGFGMACSAPTMPEDNRPVQIDLDRVNYAPNTPITVRLQNATDYAVQYDLCLVEIERLDNGVWSNFRPIAEGCPLPFTAMAPGAEIIRPFWQAPSGFPRGDYRFRFTALNPVDGPKFTDNDRRSPAFHIIG